MTMNPVCPYCGEISEFVDSAVVYNGSSYGMIYLCRNYPKCDSYVGCHRGTTQPLGRMASPELRKAKRAAHEAFDPIWREKKASNFKKRSENRKKAYADLAEKLGISVNDCHIGMFDVATCNKVVEICNEMRRKK